MQFETMDGNAPMFESTAEKYRMSRAAIGWGWFARIFFGVILIAVFILDHTVDRWIWLAVTWAFFAFAILNCGGVIEVSANGVRARNIISERWYPWESIDRFEATDRVEIVQANGATSRCWAVQRANISSMLNRESRVDVVVDQLNNARRTIGCAANSATGSTLRWVHLTVWEWSQLVLVVPALATLGALLQG